MPVKLATILLIIAAMTISCAGTKAGMKFDDLCIAGRITAEAAEWLNANQAAWKQHSDYEAPIKAGDRLFNGDCSEVAIQAAKKDKKGLWKAFRKVLGKAWGALK